MVLFLILHDGFLEFLKNSDKEFKLGRHGIKVRVRPRDPEPRDPRTLDLGPPSKFKSGICDPLPPPHKGLKLVPQNPLQNLKVGLQDLLQSLKVGPPHLSLINTFFKEYFFFFFYLFILLSFLNKIEIKYQLRVT